MGKRAKVLHIRVFEAELKSAINPRIFTGKAENWVCI
jgi:hypothetical protein